MALPIIDIKDTSKLAEAMQEGIVFKLTNGARTYTFYNEQEEIETAEGIARGEADYKAGRIYTPAQVFSHLDNVLEELGANE